MITLKHKKLNKCVTWIDKKNRYLCMCFSYSVRYWRCQRIDKIDGLYTISNIA